MRNKKRRVEEDVNLLLDRSPVGTHSVRRRSQIKRRKTLKVF
jgi:porphobilinogen deaminase